MDSLYQFVFTANACGVAVLTLLVYDWCISLGSEMTLFWRAPRTSASILYLFNRYCIMLEWALAMLTIQPVSDLSCRGLYYTELVLSYFAMIGPACEDLSVLTSGADIETDHKLLAGLTLTLALVPLFVNVSAAYQSHPVNRDPPINCSLDSSTPQQLAIMFVQSAFGYISQSDGAYLQMYVARMD
ncbi:hypothetical protein C8Q74DRAFT_1222282 [Fomes fomentarius]|nr:hypothetical protein C8Q74DRAFT_1222282 [Fomes fomentarius]